MQGKIEATCSWILVDLLVSLSSFVDKDNRAGHTETVRHKLFFRLGNFG